MTVKWSGVKVMDKRSTLCKVKETTRRLTCGFVNGLDRAGTISACDRLSKPEHEPRRGQLVSSLAVSIATGLCLLSMLLPVGKIDTAEAITIKKPISTKSYALRAIKDKTQYQCLNELYSKESGWNPTAVNGSHYGIPQLKNKIMLSKNPYEQVDYGLKYITHRYGLTANNKPNACKALHHLKTKGWH
jgi:hypothetical protein